MNNATTARAPLRHSESADILAMQVLGLLSREGSGQFVPTEKSRRLKDALERQERGETLAESELALIAECCGTPS